MRRLRWITAALTLLLPLLAGPARAADVDPCSLPLAERTGNWTCFAPSPTSLAAPESFCRIEGCWAQHGQASSSFAGSGTYGYGSEQLGTVRLDFEVRFNGARSTSWPVTFQSSRVVSNLIIAGDRLYTSATYPAGKPVEPSQVGHYERAVVPAGQTVQWKPNGYKSYDTNTSWVSIVHEWSWQDPEHPGTWYFWAKSVKALRQDSGGYWFTGADDLPDDPAHAGYNG